MPVKPIPARHILRQMLRVVLPTDSDYEAFSTDFFPEVAGRFTNGMDRIAKATLLVQLLEAEEVVAALRQYSPQRAAEFEHGRWSDAAMASNPYRGLSAFQLDEAHLFFGRDALTGQLWRRFERLSEEPDATRLLAIVGPSGSGKSSLARAGLLAALVRSPVPGPQSLRLAVMKPGERPIESLARALVPMLPPDTGVLPASRQIAIEKLLRNKEVAGQGLRRFAADLPEIGASPLVVLVDQFEELYTLARDPGERDCFVETLLHAASDSSRQVSIVLTLRSDFCGDTQRHHNALNRLIAEQGVMVPGLSPEELRDAITKPAEQAGRPLDPTTVELLLSEAKGSQGALPLLEFALTRIWEGIERGYEPGVTLRRIGGVGGALAGEAQRIYFALSAIEQATARRALVRLVQLGEGTRDTRRRAPISELCGRGETDVAVLSVLRRFAAENARLVTLGGDGIRAMAEVTHEALFEHWHELRTWIEQGRKDHELHHRAMVSARLWVQGNRDEGRLWRSLDLDLLSDYQQRKPEDLNPLQDEFLSASLRLQQHAREDAERNRQQLLDFLIERGQQLLFQAAKPSDGLLWLHRAQGEGSKNPALPILLKSAMDTVDATQVVLVGHSLGVCSAAFSPDGRRIVTTSKDHTARVWAGDGGALLAELKGHLDSVTCAAFSPDGRRIVTASWDCTARVWAADSGRLLVEPMVHGYHINRVTFSPDGRRILTAGEGKSARVWEADSGRLLTRLKGHRAAVNSAMFSPDGGRIVTASRDRTARVWESDSGQLLAEFKGHGDIIGSATFSPDGRRIVTVSGDHTARVWAADSGELLVELSGHKDIVWSAAFSPDGRRIVTGSSDQTARVWAAERGQLLAELKGHGDIVWSAMFSPDGDHIVTASEDQTTRVWVAEGRRLLVELKGHGRGITSATFSPDGGHIVTTSEDQTARVWEANSGRRLAELKGHGHHVWSAVFDPDGRRIVTTSWDCTARLWETDTGRLLATLNGHGGRVWGAMFSPDGRSIVTASEDQTARVWEASGGRLLLELKGHRDRVLSASFSPDGQRIVTASEDQSARVWAVCSGRLLTELRGHGDRVTSATFSPDGSCIVTASEDETARVWEANTGLMLTELRGHSNIIRSAAVSLDGRRIVTASADRTARVWEATGGRLLAELSGHRHPLTSAAFSLDGRHIVTASEDHTARVWEADNGLLLAELKGHGAVVTSATFSPDGRRIVTASSDHTARVWDLSPETRSYDQLATLIRRHVPAQFEREGSNIIVYRRPTPTE